MTEKPLIERLREAGQIIDMEDFPDDYATVQEAAAELQRLYSERSPWQPIETAPKNGKPILIDTIVSWSGQRVITTVRWNSGEWLDYNAFAFKPSHWMPLPAPPVPTK